MKDFSKILKEVEESKLKSEYNNKKKQLEEKAKTKEFHYRANNRFDLRAGNLIKSIKFELFVLSLGIIGIYFTFTKLRLNNRDESFLNKSNALSNDSLYNKNKFNSKEKILKEIEKDMRILDD